MSDPIRLLTFNVFLRPPPIKTNQDDFKEERFQEIMQLLDHYDIICFQEMFQTATFRPERIIQAAIQKKFFYWKISESPSFMPGPVVDSGLMVLSRYPILASHFSSYNLGILSDGASDKGYLYCKIRAQGEMLHLFVTHLQASYKLPGRELQRQLSVKTRLHQFSSLLRSIKGQIKKNGYSSEDLVLLAGDLNIDSNERPYFLSDNSCLRDINLGEGVGGGVGGLETSLQLGQKEGGRFVEFEAVNRIFQDHEIRFIDHAMLRHKGHPITFGDGDVILTGEEDVTSKQNLDYIFTLQPGTSHSKAKLRCETDSCEVQQFKREGTKFGQLSDHYGLSIFIHK